MAASFYWLSGSGCLMADDGGLVDEGKMTSEEREIHGVYLQSGDTQDRGSLAEEFKQVTQPLLAIEAGIQAAVKATCISVPGDVRHLCRAMEMSWRVTELGDKGGRWEVLPDGLTVKN
ncbi:hypothetical protein OIDMADRAFT_30862 [Oidiodendron maius Zn]|uniref:Uncharacterized protein n=1 Tax=Oidiodendron maius (strain Zn) TaxID=913774 RepID=A0A0C3CJY1_OIDMZ|nr:hypothetical protein OIDMADRAFT_30862 [Oidiodendron maius Zn]